MKKYSWNFDEGADIWSSDTFDTIEECIKDANRENSLDGHAHSVVYIGKNIAFEPFVDARNVLENIGVNNFDGGLQK